MEEKEAYSNACFDICEYVKDLLMYFINLLKVNED